MIDKAKHSDLGSSIRKLPPGAEKVGQPNPNERIEVSFILKPRQPIPPVDQIANELPHRRKYISRQEFASLYSANAHVVQAIGAFAHKSGLAITETDLTKRFVTVSGTIKQMSEAFRVDLQSFKHDDATFRGREGSVCVPAEIAGDVIGVFGLDNRRQARCFISHPTNTDPNALPEATYFATDVADLYRFPQSLGAGQTIGILTFGGGYRPGDLDKYFTEVSTQGAPKIIPVSVDGNGNAPGLDADADIELALDVQVAGAVAPASTIVIYFSEFTARGWLDALSTAIHDSVNCPSIISISWGWREGDGVWTEQAMNAFNELLKSAVHMGISVCCATGDTGSADGASDNLAHCNFPATSEYVLAVGGTMLQGASSIDSEVVWNDPLGYATGGGVSDVIGAQPWQQSAKVPANANPPHRFGRGIPDVAANSDHRTGYRIFVNDSWTYMGGTSAAAPLWAGLIALLNERLGYSLGYFNPLLYGKLSSCFRDITEGNNGAYQAQPGWDCCTGWGSPIGDKLLETLQQLET